MKLLIGIFLFLLGLDAAAQKYYGARKQKGYGQVNFAVYGNNEVSAIPGLSFGAGVLLGDNVTTGAGFDIFMFNRDKLRFSQAYADFRAYFAGLDKAGPFVSFQPGVVLVKKEQNIQVKSGFSMNVLGGFFVRLNSNVGLTGSLGYSMLTYTQEGHEKRQNGIRFNIGFCF